MDHVLIELAFSFRKARLWRKLWDDQLFAVRHSDGSLGYCCVMGKAGEHRALAVYPGAEGLRALFGIEGASEERHPWERMERAMSQDCVMVSYVNKAELLKEEEQLIADYCKAQGLRLRGEYAWPRFERFRPLRHPWRLHDPVDLLHLKEALEAAIEVSRSLETQSAEALGFAAGFQEGGRIPMVGRQGEGLVLGSVDVPELLPEAAPSMELPDELTLARLLKKPRNQLDWAAGIMMHAEPYLEESPFEGLLDMPDSAPVYPMVMQVVDAANGLLLHLMMAPTPENYPREFGKGMAGLIEKLGRPARILVMDERSRALLSAFCDQIEVPLKLRRSIPALEEAMMSFFDHVREHQEEGGADFMDADLDKLINDLLALPSLEELPDMMLEDLLRLVNGGWLDGPIVDKLRAEDGRRKQSK